MALLLRRVRPLVPRSFGWLLIERIDVAPDGISVTLHAAGIRSLVAELTSEKTEPAVLEAAE